MISPRPGACAGWPVEARVIRALAMSGVLALLMNRSSVARDQVALAIQHVTVVDVEAGRLRPDQTVVVQGRLIDRVGPATETPLPVGARVVEGRGRCLIPGLWDAHVHADEATLTRLVAYGITGAREMGGDFEERARWRRRIDAGTLIGPRLLLSGPRLVGPPDKKTANQWLITTAEEGVRAVDSLAALGVDFVKVHEGLSREAFLAIVRQAQAKGMPVAGHVPAGIDPGEASRAGERCIEHLEFISDRCLPRFHPGADTARAASLPECGSAALDSLLGGFVRTGTWLDPTIGSFRAWVAPEFYRWIFAGFRSIVPALRRSGVMMLAGTDTEGGRIPAGVSLHDELALLVDAGFTQAEALRSATINPCRCFGLAGARGAVRPGQVADLVLLDGDPLADIHNTSRVRAVVIDGRLLDHVELDRMRARATH